MIELRAMRHINIRDWAIMISGVVLPLVIVIAAALALVR